MKRFLGARLGDQVANDSTGIGGPAVTGSLNVMLNSRRALREGDRGVDMGSLCAWRADDGAPRVLINDRRAQRIGDHSSYLHGYGCLVTGSPNVIIGNFNKESVRMPGALVTVLILLNELPLPNVAVEFAGIRTVTDKDGKARFEHIPAGDCTLCLHGVAVWSDYIHCGTSRFVDIRFIFDLATCCTQPTRVKGKESYVNSRESY